MDLSAVIFVVLALAWAVYLIPKALKHHDEMASDRLIEGHSDKVRVLTRKAKDAVVDVADALTPGSAEVVDEAPEVRPTRAAARSAARRRRRVLGLLVLALVAVWALTWLAYLPIWAPAVPGALVVAWLVVSRLSVRAQGRARTTSRPLPAEQGAVADDAGATQIPETIVHAESPRTATVTVDSVDVFLEELADEHTSAAARAEAEASLAQEGSLWDPLPMTLPTYVNKARARRTVRTIELTGISSSGHDQDDSALARESAASDRAEDEVSTRRVAGA